MTSAISFVPYRRIDVRLVEANASKQRRHDRPKPLRQLDRLFSRIDARVSDIIEHGASERLYFLGVDLPRVVAQSENLIKPIRERNVPISSAVPTHLLDIGAKAAPAAHCCAEGSFGSGQEP
jgi:hypothetical protein